jgi:hypothetical protein
MTFLIMQLSPTSGDLIQLWFKLSHTPANKYALDTRLYWSREGLFDVKSMGLMVLRLGGNKTVSQLLFGRGK